VYAKSTREENSRTASGASLADGLERSQAGFRSDLRNGLDGFTVQGDLYDGHTDTRAAFGQVRVSGANLLGRWTRSINDGSDVRVQAYYDKALREDFSSFQQDTDLFDVEAQYGVAVKRHRLQFGGGYREARDDSKPSPLGGGLIFFLQPQHQELSWANFYAQDEISLTGNLALTLGMKYERNDYTGWEHLPSARLAWTPSSGRLVWAAISRAVRAPARIDRELHLRFSAPPAAPFDFIAGGPNFVSEVANVIELGYREQLTRTVSYSVTLFHSDYDRLRSGRLPPAVIENRIDGTNYGVEAWGAWQATTAWRLTGGFFTLRQHLGVEPGSNDPTGPSALGNDPEYQLSLRSAYNVTSNQQFDVMARHVAALPNPNVPAYTAVDARYAWQVRRGLELSLIAQDLFDKSHAEFGALPGRAEVSRGIALRARWSL
jgi:iron complex outermembrane receptor protein